MRAKNMGRHELLSWVNTTVQSDYSKIENLSDGIAYCQIVDAFYANSIDILKLKYNSKNQEDWEKNFQLLNEALQKIKSLKQIDPVKMVQSKFVTNFEFLQFLYDFIIKNNSNSSVKYNAFERRVEAIKHQTGNKGNVDVKKLLPQHLIPNDLILRMDKQKFYGDDKKNNININSINSLNNDISMEFSTTTNNNQIQLKIDKYKDFFFILKEDLKKTLDKNVQIAREIQEVEEERNYYLEKIKNVYNYCNSRKDSDTALKILNIIEHVPEDFK